MKRLSLVVFTATVALSFSTPLRAQMGMDFFKKPAIADIFKPVVGAGAVYETDHNGNKSPMEMTVVGKDSVDGKDAYWLEFGHSGGSSNAMSYGKVLVTVDDFQFHRMIVQPTGQPQPVEVAINQDAARRNKVNEALEKWHKVGTESITVPAGTFSCDHWTRDDGKGDAWVSPKISPMSLVKETDSGNSIVLVKIITDAKDHITGTPTKFDPEAMKRQMMEKMQKQQKP
jgi:hypothetical protein